MGKYEKHVKRRYEDHSSVRKTAEEFGVGKSTIHRIITKKEEQEQDES